MTHVEVQRCPCLKCGRLHTVTCSRAVKVTVECVTCSSDLPKTPDEPSGSNPSKPGQPPKQSHVSKPTKKT